MMRLATMKCPDPNCGAVYDVALEDGEWHAKCPVCGQRNRVPGINAGEAITGLCKYCSRPLDDHLYGRLSFACPPKGK